jgi:DNA-binding NarL/FixJ family response regulator
MYPLVSRGKVRLAVVSNNPLTALALKQLLHEGGLECHTVNLEPAGGGVAATADQPPDLVIVESALPDADLVRQLRTHLPKTQVMFLLASTTACEAGTLDELDVDCFWTQRSSPRALLKALLMALADEPYGEPAFMRPVSREIPPGATGRKRSGQTIALSRREQEILELIQQGCSNQQIANHLFLSLSTVKNHTRNILMKLSANNRTEAAFKAMHPSAPEAVR